LKITFVIPFVNLTGGIRLLLDYANWLHDEGHRVTVVYPLWPYRYHLKRRDQLLEFRKQLRTGRRIDWFDLRCRLLRVPFIANAFLPRGDLVLATSWPTAYSVASLDASRGKKLYVVFHHETGTGPEERIVGTYGLPFCRISFSRSVRDLMAGRFGCEIHAVIPASVDTARFFPDGERTNDTVLMLYHNDPRKGADDGIQALTLLRSRLPDVRVRMCGTVRPSDLPSWIPFDFHPSDADLRRLYSTSTVFLYSSRYEGFGLPPLESMACACPVVTTDVGAVCEFVVHRRNALMVQPCDVRGMAGGLEEMLLNPRLRAELSRRGLETARQYALTRNAPLFADALIKAFRGESRGTDVF
jgi:glycosyltransferase involved in cell wall biosynthesis